MNLVGQEAGRPAQVWMTQKRYCTAWIVWLEPQDGQIQLYDSSELLLFLFLPEFAMGWDHLADLVPM